MDTITTPTQEIPSQKTSRKISTELLQELINYLSKQPFGEVHQLIGALVNLPVED